MVIIPKLGLAVSAAQLGDAVNTRLHTGSPAAWCVYIDHVQKEESAPPPNQETCAVNGLIVLPGLTSTGASGGDLCTSFADGWFTPTMSVSGSQVQLELYEAVTPPGLRALRNAIDTQAPAETRAMARSVLRTLAARLSAMPDIEEAFFDCSLGDDGALLAELVVPRARLGISFEPSGRQSIWYFVDFRDGRREHQSGTIEREGTVPDAWLPALRTLLASKTNVDRG